MRNAKRIFAWLAVFVMLLSACTDPGASDDTTTETTTSTTAAPAGGTTDSTTGSSDTTVAPFVCDEPIRIGVLQPLTGGLAASGTDAKDGFELYWANHPMEIGGCTVEFRVEDTAGNPDTALQKVDELVDNYGADIIVGELLANVTAALAERLADNPDVIMMSPIGSADDLTQRTLYPNFTRAGGWTSSQTSHVLGQWAFDQGYTSAASICTDYAFGWEMCGGFTQVFTEAGGTVDPNEQLWNPLGSTDLGTYVTQLDGFKPDAVFVLEVGASVSDFFQNWSDFGLKDEIPILAGETTGDVAYIRNIPVDQVEGLISSGHWAEGRDAPETQEFVQVFDAATTRLPSYYAAATWTAAQYIDETIRAMNGDLSDKAATLETMKGLELLTPFGPSRLDDYGNPIYDIYIRKAVVRDDGRIWNEVIETFENIDQFWPKTPEEYLKQPVYSRDFQGNAGS